MGKPDIIIVGLHVIAVIPAQEGCLSPRCQVSGQEHWLGRLAIHVVV